MAISGRSRPGFASSTNVSSALPATIGTAPQLATSRASASGDRVSCA
jgi:hypothetical protein